VLPSRSRSKPRSCVGIRTQPPLELLDDSDDFGDSMARELLCLNESHSYSSSYDKCRCTRPPGCNLASHPGGRRHESDSCYPHELTCLLEVCVLWILRAWGVLLSDFRASQELRELKEGLM